MFIVLIFYKEPLETIEKYLVAHRSHLDEGYRRDFLVASGPRNPRTGGILISHVDDQSVLETFLKQDPFILHDVASYEIIEFIPNKAHQDFQRFIAKKASDKPN